MESLHCELLAKLVVAEASLEKQSLVSVAVILDLWLVGALTHCRTLPLTTRSCLKVAVQLDLHGAHPSMEETELEFLDEQDTLEECLEGGLPVA